MSSIKVIIVIVFASFLISCGGTKQISKFDAATVNHHRIAVLPFQSKIKLTKEQKGKIDESQLADLEVEQGKEVQDAVESYLVNKDLKVRVMSANMTNAKLKENKIDLRYIADQDYTNLASILGVDGIVAGYIETQKPMSEAAATGLDIAKGLERSLLGSSFGSNINTSTNKGSCKLSVYDGKTGDRLWSYNDDIEMSKGSSTQDMINILMKKGARSFPYKS
jgi:hypothetical protein